MKIVSFSLYGSLPIYTEGAIRNAELVRRFYPGWTARFYVDRTVPDDVVAALREREADIVRVEKNLGPMYGRYWRMFVAADPDVELFLIRDCAFAAELARTGGRRCMARVGAFLSRHARFDSS